MVSLSLAIAVKSRPSFGGGVSGPYISLSSILVLESATIGTTVGALSVVGATGTPVFTLTDSAGGRFAISGSNLNTALALDYETATFHNITVHVTGMTPTVSDRVFTIFVTDVASVLSLPVDTVTGDNTASLGVTINEPGGFIYWVVTTSSTAPTATQIKTGKNHLDAVAADSGSQAVVSSGAQSITGGADGLTAGTAYFAHFVHEQAVSGTQSNIVTGDGFTTTGSASTAGTPIGLLLALTKAA